jgi:hypothetical protein
MALKVKHVDLRTPRMTLAAFGEMYDLTLVVTRYTEKRFTVAFDSVEVKEGEHGAILASIYGDADTPAAAAKRYAELIQGQRLVVHATRPDRQTIDVPVLEGMGIIEGITA